MIHTHKGFNQAVKQAFLRTAVSTEFTEEVVSVEEARSAIETFERDVTAQMTRANEIANTQNPAWGGNLVQVNGILKDTVIDPTHSCPNIANLFSSGYLGTGLGCGSFKYPVLGANFEFNRHIEQKDAPLNCRPDYSTSDIGTMEVKMGMYEVGFAVSKKQMKCSVVDFINMVTNKLQPSYTDMIDKIILNSDDDVTATNINTNGAVPPVKKYFLENNNGLRDLALANTATKIDVAWPLTRQVLIDLRSKVKGCCSQDYVYITDCETYSKLLSIQLVDPVLQQSAEAVNSTGIAGSILGIPVVTSKHLQLTDATGKVSSTPANNVKGQILLVDRTRLYHGFGDTLNIDVTKCPGGAYIYAEFDFAFGILHDPANPNTGAAVGIAYNITL